MEELWHKLSTIDTQRQFCDICGRVCVLPIYSGNVSAYVLVFVMMTQHLTELWQYGKGDE